MKLTNAINFIESDIQVMLSNIKKGNISIRTNAHLLIGPPGIGKTESTENLIKKLVGIPSVVNVDSGFTEIDGINVGFKFDHGPNLDIYKISIPTVNYYGLSKESQNFIEKAYKETDHIKKEVYTKAAVKSMSLYLDEILNHFYTYLIENKIQYFIYVIQDFNKNGSEDFNNFIKTLLDRYISSKRLPPITLILTCNPYSPRYCNQKIDETIRSASAFYNIEIDTEASIKYLTSKHVKNNKFIMDTYGENFLVKFFSRTYDFDPEFKNTRSFLYKEEDTNDDTPITTPRSWDLALTFSLHLLEEEERDLKLFVDSLSRYICNNIANEFSRYILLQKSFKTGIDISTIARDPIGFARKVSKHTDTFNAIELLNYIMVNNVSLTNLKKFVEASEEELISPILFHFKPSDSIYYRHFDNLSKVSEKEKSAFNFLKKKWLDSITLIQYNY